MLATLRRWLRSDMKVMRWVFLALYMGLIVAFLLPWILAAELGSAILTVAIMLGSQALFIFGAGTINLCRPIRKRRLVLPVVIGVLMLVLLLGGALIAVIELVKFDPDDSDAFFLVFLGFLVLNWIGWSILLLSHARRWERRTVLSRLTTAMFAGSLLELMVSVPSHVIVSRRPGCLVGMGTMTGIIAGVLVMAWSFGPAIVLLFLRPRYRREKHEWETRCSACGYDLRVQLAAGGSADRCPECGTVIAR